MTEATTIHPVDLHVGRRLRLARVERKWSQEILAQAGDVTFQQVQKYEKGTNRVSASMLWTFAQALDLPIAWFFEGLPDAPTGEVASDEDVRAFVDTAAGRDLVHLAVLLRGPVLDAHTHLMRAQIGAAAATPLLIREDRPA